MTMDDFSAQVYGTLDKKLLKYEYLCGEEMTVADIIVYTEL